MHPRPTSHCIPIFDRQSKKNENRAQQWHSNITMPDTASHDVDGNVQYNPQDTRLNLRLSQRSQTHAPENLVMAPAFGRKLPILLPRNIAQCSNASTDPRGSKPPVSHRRRHCLTCMCNKSPCKGLPLCNKYASTVEQIDLLTAERLLIDYALLDWRAWYTTLFFTLPVTGASRMMAVVPDGVADHITLSFGFRDVQSQASSPERIPVTLHRGRLRHQRWYPGDGTLRWRYEPALDVDQLHSVVQDLLWGRCYALGEHSKQQSLTSTEYELLSKAQLFSGYLDLFTILDSTRVYQAVKCDKALLVEAAIEFTYTLVFNLSMLFNRIASLCQELQVKNHNRRHAPIVTQALRVVYLIAHCCMRSRWMLDEDQRRQPLSKLHELFLDRMRYCLKRIEIYECVITGKNIRARQSRRPSMLKLALAWYRNQQKRLPRSCDIVICRNGIPFREPTQLDASGSSVCHGRYITDILLQNSETPSLAGDATIGDQPDHMPDEMLQEDRSIVAANQDA